MATELISFGNGFSGYFIDFKPDRKTPYMISKYKKFPDLERIALIVKCEHGQIRVPIHPKEYNEIFGYTPWEVVTFHPLTLNPSIKRKECGCHGWIIGGNWVSVNYP